VVITGDAVIGWTPFMGDGYPEDWVTTLDRLAELDWDTLVMGHGEPAGREWLRTFRGYIHDMVEAVREEAATGASLDDVKARVTTRLAPTYEPAFSTYQHYRPWRQGLLANIERTYAMVS
jgi:glyoxylase-like metal-dependent hydrolase (beta-lactamase superfamily II)